MTRRDFSWRESGWCALPGHLAAFAIPCLMFLEVKVGGRLFGSEIALGVVLPFLLFSKGRYLQDRLLTTVIFLGLLWLGLQIFTDIFRETPLEDYARGWAKITIFLINFVAIYLLLRGWSKRLLLFGLGIAVGQILAYYISPHEFAKTYPWKFGVGIAITNLSILLSQTSMVRRARLLPEIIVGLIGLVNVYFGFRSFGLICLLTAGYMLLLSRSDNSLQRDERPRTRTSWSQFVTVFGTFIVVGVAAFWMYGHAASSGWLGEEAETKYRAQSAGDLGMLLGGRKEILASSQAIIDSPIIGHGSWAKDASYVDLATYFYGQLGYEPMGVTDSELIPTHSYIFGAWVEAGILGAIFWIWIVYQAMKFLLSADLRQSTYVGWVVFIILLLLWDVMFSPFGAGQRLSAAYSISAIFLALKQVREMLRQTRNSKTSK